MESSAKLMMDDLPNEVLVSILHRVRDQDFLRKSINVCKKWYEIIASRIFWIEYHQFWRNRLPFNCDFPWQYYADIRHGHSYEKNLLPNASGNREIFPTQAYFMQRLPDFNIYLRRNGNWRVYTDDGPEETENSVVFRSSHMIFLKSRNIFQEKSLFMSDYQVEATINLYVKPLQEKDLFIELDFNCEDYRMNTDLSYGELDSEYKTFSSNKKWTKIVLSKTVSLKNMRSVHLSLGFHYSAIDDIPFGTSLPRATLKFSFPMQNEQVPEVPKNHPAFNILDSFFLEKEFDLKMITDANEVSDSEPEKDNDDWTNWSNPDKYDEFGGFVDHFYSASEASTDEGEESDLESGTDDDWSDIDTEALCLVVGQSTMTSRV